MTDRVAVLVRLDPAVHAAAVLAAATCKVSLNRFISEAICEALASEGMLPNRLAAYRSPGRPRKWNVAEEGDCDA